MANLVSPSVGKESCAGPTVRFDTRLAAAVQAAAGRRCHQAANLLHAYYLSAALCRQLEAAGGVDAIAALEASQLLQAAKVRLREFLAECLMESVGTPALLHRDCPARHLAGRVSSTGQPANYGCRAAH